MKVSRRGVDLVAAFEGFRARPYRDAVGVWTVGFGETHGVGPNHPPVTRQEAFAMLQHRLERDFGAEVKRLARVPLTQGQYDALASFAYNVGVHALATSTLLRKLNEGRPRAAADEFLKWDKAGGMTLPGLTRRRKAERALFLSENRRLGKWRAGLHLLRVRARRRGWSVDMRSRARKLKSLIAREESRR